MQLSKGGKKRSFRVVPDKDSRTAINHEGKTEQRTKVEMTTTPFTQTTTLYL